MSIVMLILKIIGILLLLALAAAALILFYPLSYRARGVFGDEVSATGDVWWLFRALRLKFSLQSGEVTAKFYIFGFLKKENKPEVEEGSFEDSGAIDFLEKESEAVEDGETARQESQIFEGGGADFSEPGDLQEAPKPKRRKRAAKKPARPGRAKRVWQEISDTGNRQAAAHIWQELLYLLSRAKPENIEADISFCAKDPALTGKITGILSMLPFIYRYDAHICPDFASDEYYVRGSFSLRGRVAVFHFVRSLIRLMRDKKVMRLYHKAI